MSIAIEDLEVMSDDSSVIFLSDVEVASDDECVDNSKVIIAKDIVKEEFINKSTLKQARPLKDSVANKSEKSVVVRCDKETQTWEHDFPITHVPQATPNALVTFNKNLLKQTQEPAQIKKRSQITFPEEVKKSESAIAHTDRKNWRNNRVEYNNNRRESRPYVSSRNYDSGYSRQNNYKTWDQKRNTRFQPYQRQSYNVWENPQNNYYGQNSSYHNYQRNYSNNNYNRQLDNYNRYGITTYNTNHYGVQYYTYSFKQRVFNGFIRYMNFVYECNHQ